MLAGAVPGDIMWPMTTATHGLGPTRARVLALLQKAGSPLSVVCVAEELGLHKNSARFHLDALASAGYAKRTVGATGQQGRPPQLFTATDSAPTLNSLHLLELSQILLAEFVLPTQDSSARMEQVGHRWGAFSAADAADEGEAPTIAGLIETLGGRGFVTSEDGNTLRFERCPFRSQVSPELLPLLCSMHKGLLNGYLAEIGSDLRATQLEVGSSVCVATLKPVPVPEEPENANAAAASD